MQPGISVIDNDSVSELVWHKCLKRAEVVGDVQYLIPIKQ